MHVSAYHLIPKLMPPPHTFTACRHVSAYHYIIDKWGNTSGACTPPTFPEYCR